MRIALDFDETITEDPHFWSEFVRLAKRHGHSVTIVTFRMSSHENSDIAGFAHEHDIAFICTGGKQKASCHQADVWIDDMPAIIPHITDLRAMLLGYDD
jgi:hypothetical protein